MDKERKEISDNPGFIEKWVTNLYCLRLLKMSLLSDRSKPPRCWWWPLRTEEEGSQEILQQQFDDCSKTINRVLMSLIAFCFFCALTLLASDVSLLGAGAEIKIPFANAEVSYIGFLFIGPIILIGLTIYLHIFVGQWLKYETLTIKRRTPYIFNMCETTPWLLSKFLLYWLVPLMLLNFAVKAGPRPEGPMIYQLFLIVTIVLVWLQIRRCPDTKRKWNRHRWVVLLFMVVFLISNLFIPDFLYIPMAGEFRISYGSPIARPLNLYGASLKERDLRRFNLMRADMDEADLTKANLEDADLERASLRRATLTGATLRRANLMEANLSKANLGAANMTQSNLAFSQLVDTDMTQANLFKADLNSASFRGAKLDGANLTGADLKLTKELTQKQVDSACLGDGTRLPEYLQMPPVNHAQCQFWKSINEHELALRP